VKTSLLKNGFYNTVGGILRIGLGIITIPLLIRQLGVEEYGLWTLASAVIGVVTLAEAGLSTATTVFVAQDLGEEDVDGLSQTLTVTVTMMLMMATLAAVSLWFGADLLTNLFPNWCGGSMGEIGSTDTSRRGASLSTLRSGQSNWYNAVITE
jgi:O-antigen/teichoic acid export membrane protein